MDKFLSSPKKLWRPPSCDDFESPVASKRTKAKSPEHEKDCTEIFHIGEVAPACVEDLAAPSKKVEELKSWLQHTAKTRRAPMLLVTGPTGSGKTSALRMVAGRLQLCVHEWVTPVDKAGWNNDTEWRQEAHDRVSFHEQNQLDKFSDFVFRISRYDSLFAAGQSSVTLVEDYPNVFLWDPSSFHNFLAKYHVSGKAPLVFICTEDNLGIHQKLFPNHVKLKYNIDTIKFNPVTKSSIVKVLTRVLNEQSNYLQVELSKQTLENISETSQGDIRSAVSGLQVLLVGMKATQVKPSKRRKKSGDPKVESAITNKDHHVEFFQAIGRVLYPKRLATCDITNVNLTPRHDESVFLYNVFELADRFSNTFLMMLHENYMNRFTYLSDVIAASECLSQCDVLYKEDATQEYGGVVGVIGVMSANTLPKKVFQPLTRSPNPKPNVTHSLQVRHVTIRELNLDVIPFAKKLPQWSWKLNEHSSDRFLRPAGVADDAMTTTTRDDVFSDGEDNLDIEEDED